MRLEEIKLWKFNILDITILFVLAIFIALFITNKSTATNNEETTEKIDTISKFSYVVTISSVAESTGEILKVGDSLYDKVTSTEIGKIKKVEVKPASGYYNTPNGEIKLTTVPNKIDVKLTVETDGNVKEGEYYANNLIRIMAGGIKQLKTKYVMFTGEIVGFED